MSAAAPAKFTFDLDMSTRREKTSVMPERELAQRLEAARQEGHAQGVQAGTQSAEAQANRAFQAAAESLANQSVQLLQAMDRTHRDALGQAARIGQTIGKKLASHLLERYPQAELEALIADSMAALEDAPHHVIRCHPDLAEPIKSIAQAHVDTSGFNGRLLILGEPDIALGDGRIKWADGGLVRDSAAIAEEIDATITAWLDAQSRPAPQGGSE